MKGAVLCKPEEKGQQKNNGTVTLLFITLTFAKAPPRVHPEALRLRRRSLVFTEGLRPSICACAPRKGPPNGLLAVRRRTLPSSPLVVVAAQLLWFPGALSALLGWRRFYNSGAAET